MCLTSKPLKRDSVVMDHRHSRAEIFLYSAYSVIPDMFHVTAKSELQPHSVCDSMDIWEVPWLEEEYIVSCQRWCQTIKSVVKVQGQKVFL